MADARMQDEEYLGDAVYVGHDGYHFWLRTGDGNNQWIALEPPVLDRLIDYRRRIVAKYSVSEDESP